VGTLVGCSEGSDGKVKAFVSKNVDIVDINVSENKKDDNSSEVLLKELEEKQKKLALQSQFDDELLKSSNKKQLHELQKLKWNNQILYEKSESKRYKEESSSEVVELKTLENRSRRFNLISTLEEDSLKYNEKELLKELQKLKWEREVMTEKFELQKIKDEKANYEEKQKQLKELEALQHKVSLAEAKAQELEQELALKRSELEFKQSKVASEIALLKVKKERDEYIVHETNYLDNPLSDDNKTLTISDRRIELNGHIFEDMATRITNQINYYNNKNSEKPIFLVIDYSGGGSVFAGNLIIKAIESSKAPVYVVLKSFAASMAAVIVTLADKSFAYPNAMMLHHEIKGYGGLGSTSLTQEREKYEDMKKSWEVFAKPIAEKMGVTLDEYVKLLYANSSSGDWKEFALAAHKLKWVNNIVNKIEDNSVRIDPLHKEEESGYGEEVSYRGEVKNVNETGETVHYLPKLRPADMYYIYNPNGYYQIR